MYKVSLKHEMPDWGDVENEIEEAAEEAMQEIAEELEWEVRRLAAGRLEETMSTYLDDLEVETNGLEVTIGFKENPEKGKLSQYVEEGSRSFDMKPGFLGEGLYRVIPMQGKDPLRFRTVTTQSRGWKHPGIKPRNFIEKAVEKVQSADVARIFAEKLQSRIKF